MNCRSIHWATLLMLLPGSVAQAALVLTLPVQPIVLLPGETVEIHANIDNQGATSVLINSLDLNWTAPQLDVNPFPFLMSLPLNLPSGEQVDVVILTISAAPDATPVEATVTFSLLGGVDENAFNDLASIDIGVQVPGGGIVDIPEPATGGMLGVAGLLLAVALRQKSHRSR